MKKVVWGRRAFLRKLWALIASGVLAGNVAFAQTPAPAKPKATCVTQTAGSVGLGSAGLKTGSKTAAQLNQFVYECQAETAGEQTPVTKTWFKAHCKGDDWRASCDAFAPNDGSATYANVATPPTHKVRNVVLGVAVGAAVVACLASGGCAALGGGN